MNINRTNSSTSLDAACDNQYFRDMEDNLVLALPAGSSAKKDNIKIAARQNNEDLRFKNPSAMNIVIVSPAQSMLHLETPLDE